MNTQTRLSDLDRTKLVNLQLRQQLLNNEAELFHRDVFAAYGNPGEQLSIGVNGELARTPKAPPPAVETPTPSEPPAAETKPPKKKR